MAAEYILAEGNEHGDAVRARHPHVRDRHRNTLDLMAVPVLKELTHLPVVVDPSHAAGRRDLVAAAVARRGRRRRRRHHRRGPPEPRGGDLRRPAGAARGRVRRVRRSKVEQRRGGRRQGPFARGAAEAQAALIVAVLGVGLIGGSVGLAARQRLGRARAGWRPAARRRSSSVERGAVDEACRHRAARSTAPTSRFVCAPVDVLPAGRARRARRGAGGLRGDGRRLDQARGRRGGDRRPALRRRPPAGRRRGRGVEHARADLFEGATWYLTPHADDERRRCYERLHRFVTGLGARPRAIDAGRRTTG